MTYKFINTKDNNVRNKLLEFGFVEVANNSNTYTFINKPFVFENNNIDLSKIKYTNILCI